MPPYGLQKVTDPTCNNAGRFIISFDCEGKWGIADKIKGHPGQHWTRRDLRTAYSRLLDLLRKYELKATFAFVGSFILSPDEFWDLPFHGEVLLRRPELRVLAEDFAARRFDGWFAPELLDLVRDTPCHEIASHGFSHLPVADAALTRAQFRREMELMCEVGRYKGIKFETLVYPRNQIGFIDEVSANGLIGYRDLLPDSSAMVGRVHRLTRELNLRQRAQANANPQEVVCIPPGYFCNWRTRQRKWIPVGCTQLRWNHIIRDAVHRRRVAHIWLHPHNLIDGTRQYELFERILQIAVREVERGNLANVTQLEYCQAIQKQLFLKAHRLAA